MSKRLNSILLITIFLFSGIAGLTYQLIWLRQLHLIFGVTSFALATVLAAFMAGLALGSYYLGRLADRVSNPLRLYALLEIGIGVYALFIPLLFRGLDNLYILIGQSASYSSLLLDIFRFIGAFVIILIPSTFMGGTLPLVSKYYIAHRDELGYKVSLLYGINTLGATVGTFITGFFLLKEFGVQFTTYLAVIINFLVGVSAWALTCFSAAATEKETAEREPRQASTASAGSPFLRKIILVAIGISGFASLCYEVLWGRALIYFLGLTTYAYTTMLTAFLIGIALGSFLILKFADRLKNPLLLLALLELTIGIFAFVLLPLIHSFYPLSQTISAWFGQSGWWSTVGVRFLIALILMLPPTSCMGATLPLAIKYYTKNIAVMGRDLGAIYAVNTIGSILGSLVAGFILVPLAGVRLGIAIVVAINILIALLLFVTNPAIPIKRQRVFSGTGLMVLVALFFLADNRPMILSSVEFTGLQKRYNLLYVNENSEASIAVLEDRVNGERELNINGESTAFTIYQDMQVHKLLGHLPSLLHKAPQNFLVVGFGFGSTAYASTLYPNAQVDCIEILPEEIETAPFFLPQNHGVVDFSNFNLIIGDGRDYIKLTDKKYDIISFNAIHPKISPNLYTRDFYELCKNILSDDGIIIAWMPPNAITETEFKSLANTFGQVFVHSSLWYVNPSHFLIMGTPSPLKIDMQLLRHWLKYPAIRADLGETSYDNPYEILSNFVATEQDLYSYAAASPINTDDHPQIEFSQVHTVTVNFDVIRGMQRIKQNVAPYLTGFDSEEEREKILDTLDRYNEAKKWVVEGQVLAWNGQYSAAEDYYLQALSVLPGNANAEYLLSLVHRRKADLIKLVNINPMNAKAIKALGDIYLEERNITEAQILLSRAINLDPNYTEAIHSLGVTYLDTRQLDRALALFIKVLANDRSNGAAAFYAGQCNWQMGKLPAALIYFQLAVDNDPDQAVNHYWLGQALLRSNKRLAAIAEFQRALSINPQYQLALEILAKLR